VLFLYELVLLNPSASFQIVLIWVSYYPVSYFAFTFF